MTLNLYASIGDRLTRYRLDASTQALSPMQTLVLPSGLQYLCRHARLPIVYAACSDSWPRRPGTRHVVCALTIAADGQLEPFGQPVQLAARPVHISLDRSSKYLFLTYPNVSAVTVHRVLVDGSIGSAIEQHALGLLGKTAHQTLPVPFDDRMVTVIRGDDPDGDVPEAPGALIFSRLSADGVLQRIQAVAPDGGYGFGPRHVDFHPVRPWMYVSMERENQLAFFEIGDEVREGCARLDAVAGDGRRYLRQLGGAIHVDPAGRFVYMSNRADRTTLVDGQEVLARGENSIAVFSIDPLTGRPTHVRNIDSLGVHPRAFSIDPSGRWLVAANMTARTVLKNGSSKFVPASLVVFEISDDGDLHLASKLDLDVGGDLMFWTGWIGAD